MEHALHGACACGRNRYVIQIPPGSSQQAQVLFDNTNATRQHLASPLTAYLRIPLPWYHSFTFAHLPDETPRHIRRVFSSAFAPHTRRQFCGFCGTQLTSWDERTTDNAEHISLTLGSLIDEDLVVLEQLGLLPALDDSEDDIDHEDVLMTNSHGSQDSTVARNTASLLGRGTPWFEDLIDGSRLGRIKRQTGGHTYDDGRVTVEWEIVEWTEEADKETTDTGATLGKRKIGEVIEDESDQMRA